MSANLPVGSVVELPSRWPGLEPEIVTIVRTMQYMRPLPAGYRPVRFADGGVLLAHLGDARVIKRGGRS